MLFIKTLYLVKFIIKNIKITKINFRNKFLGKNKISNLGKIYFINYITKKNFLNYLNSTIIKFNKPFIFFDKNVSFNTNFFFSYENYSQLYNYTVDLL